MEKIEAYKILMDNYENNIDLDEDLKMAIAVSMFSLYQEIERERNRSKQNAAQN